jgi:undecaprenyl-diphosphatase
MDDSVHDPSQRGRSRRLRRAAQNTRGAVLTGARWLGRQEAAVLVAALSVLLALFGFVKISEQLGEGELAHLDEWLLLLLRVPGQPHHPVGPSWLVEAARDITPLGGRTMLVVVTLFAIGYLALERKYGALWLVGLATAGCQARSQALRRTRPSEH